jgi:predicted phage tail protein
MGAIEFQMLAVVLHGELLEVGGEAFRILVARQDDEDLRAVEVVIPQSQEAMHDGDVLHLILNSSLSSLTVNRLLCSKLNRFFSSNGNSLF